MDGRMLRVQAFAVMSLADQRVGTVIVVRDVTEAAQRERARAALLDQLVEDMGLASSRARSRSSAFSARSSATSAALQKMIVEMRELLSRSDAQLVQPADARDAAGNAGLGGRQRMAAGRAGGEPDAQRQRRALRLDGLRRRTPPALGDGQHSSTTRSSTRRRAAKSRLRSRARRTASRVCASATTASALRGEELPKVFTRFFRGAAGQRERAGAARSRDRAGLDDCPADHRGARRADLRCAVRRGSARRSTSRCRWTKRLLALTRPRWRCWSASPTTKPPRTKAHG